MKPTVLLIDDETLPMEFYVRALERSDFEVKQCVEPDSALQFIENGGVNIAVIILDIMMPPGEKYKDEDTQDGLRTGVFLYRDLPDVPVIVLTNVKNPKTLEMFQAGPRLKVVQKVDCPPFELVALVSEMVEVASGDSSAHEGGVSL